METKLVKLMIRLARFPNATICRHDVAMDILNILQNDLPEDTVAALAKAFSDGSNGDEQALELLQDLTE